MSFRILFLFLLLLSLSCKKDNAIIDIDAPFQIYVDEFIAEGAKRGIMVDFADTGLSIKFDDISITAGGVCSELGNAHNGQHKIGISQTAWKQYLPQQRKRLIFHELGHCELNRPHDNKVLANNEWKSIMRGDPIPEGRSTLVNFTGLREQYYIDELFDPSIESPYWANEHLIYDFFKITDTVLHKSIDSEILLEKFSLDESKNFQIEIQMMQNNGYGVGGFRWGPGSQNDDMNVYFFEGNKLVLGSGSNIADDFYIKNFDQIESNKEHLLTIRKMGNTYHYFLDKIFLYQNDFIPMEITTLSSFTNSNVKVYYSHLQIVYFE